jgi:hypothetical protein
MRIIDTPKIPHYTVCRINLKGKSLIELLGSLTETINVLEPEHRENRSHIKWFSETTDNNSKEYGIIIAGDYEAGGQGYFIMIERQGAIERIGSYGKKLNQDTLERALAILKFEPKKIDQQMPRIYGIIDLELSEDPSIVHVGDTHPLNKGI